MLFVFVFVFVLSSLPWVAVVTPRSLFSVNCLNRITLVVNQISPGWASSMLFVVSGESFCVSHIGRDIPLSHSFTFCLLLFPSVLFFLIFWSFLLILFLLLLFLLLLLFCSCCHCCLSFFCCQYTQTHSNNNIMLYIFVYVVILFYEFWFMQCWYDTFRLSVAPCNVSEGFVTYMHGEHSLAQESLAGPASPSQPSGILAFCFCIFCLILSTML